MVFCIHQKLNKHVLLLILDCKEYPFLVKDDMRILHGDKLLLFVNGCYGLYKLKCLKIQFSLWKI